jgi:hypothetical protein
MTTSSRPRSSLAWARRGRAPARRHTGPGGRRPRAGPRPDAAGRLPGRYVGRAYQDPRGDQRPAAKPRATSAGTGAAWWPRLARFAFRPARPVGVLARDVDLVAGLLRDSDRHGDLPRLPDPAGPAHRLEPGGRAAARHVHGAAQLRPPGRRRPGAIRRSQSASGATLEFREGRDILEVRSAMPREPFQIQDGGTMLYQPRGTRL